MVLRQAVRALFAAALAVLALCPEAAVAAPPPGCTAKDRKAAQSLADKGFEQYEASDYNASIESFGKAEERCHSPRLVVFLARAHARLGKLLRARELLEQAAAEPLTRRSPASFRDAQVEARKDLEALKPRIPVLQLLITGAPPDELALTLDGQDVDASELSRGRDLDPGEHTVDASAPGYEPLTRHLVLREAVVERIEVAMRKVAPPPPPKIERPSLAPPIAAFAVGAVGIGVGAVTGLLSIGAADDIKSRCVDNQCLKSDAGAGDKAELLGNVSTIGFVVGGAGLAAGVILLALRPGEARRAPAGAAQVRLDVGPGSLRLGGTF